MLAAIIPLIAFTLFNKSECNTNRTTCSETSPWLYSGRCYESYAQCHKAEKRNPGGLIDMYYGGHFIVFIAIFITSLILVFVYAFFGANAPNGFISFATIVSFVLLAIICVTITILYHYYYPLIVVAVLLCLGILIYYCIKPRLSYTRAVFVYSMRSFQGYSSYFFGSLILAFFEIAATFIFVTSAYIIYINYTLYALIPFLVYYYWVHFTFKNISYVYCSRIISTHYFLNGTNLMPKASVLFSFGRSIFKTCGSCILTALAVPFMDVLEWLADSFHKGVFIFNCIAVMFEFCLHYLTHRSLIYCAMFGCPPREGSRRIQELRAKKYIHVLMNDLTINHIVNFNAFVFAAFGGCMGYVVGRLMTAEGEEFNLKAEFGAFAGVFIMFAVYGIFTAPLISSPETVIICFAEYPEKMSMTNYETHDVIAQNYHHDLENLRKGFCNC